jgi:catalase
VTIEASPSVLFDGVVLPDGLAAETFANDGNAAQFVKDAYRHCKPILALGTGVYILEMAGIPQSLPDGTADNGLLRATADEVESATGHFIAALLRHRVYERETDPPRV